jgi:hypothetical protein
LQALLRRGKTRTPEATIHRIHAALEAERATEGYARRRKADARRRDKAHAEYVEDFFGGVLAFRRFTRPTPTSPAAWHGP